MQKVRKAIFPVGGLGTRFLPATKALPKEMLPIVDKPLIQYAVEEALTTYGLIGVKVWICKGEVYGKRSLTPIETIVVGTKRSGGRKKK